MTQIGDYETGLIYCGECADLMMGLPDGRIPLTVTSPPYGKARKYKGFVFDYKPILSQLFRVTSQGGVLVWVTNDETIKGKETGESFRQALYAMDIVGWSLYDTMIYETAKQPQNRRRYEPKFEYMFVFTKGTPRTWNPITERATYAGQKTSPRKYNKDGTLEEWSGDGIIKQRKVLGNIWYMQSGNGRNQGKGKHPAVFPLELPKRHIITWTNPGDLVFDPMCGSGTTLVAAREEGRDFLGFDISSEYVQDAGERVAGARLPLLTI